jgi:hypothetical protein
MAVFAHRPALEVRLVAELIGQKRTVGTGWIQVRVAIGT